MCILCICVWILLGHDLCTYCAYLIICVNIMHGKNVLLTRGYYVYVYVPYVLYSVLIMQFYPFLTHDLCTYMCTYYMYDTVCLYYARNMDTWFSYS